MLYSFDLVFNEADLFEYYKYFFSRPNIRLRVFMLAILVPIVAVFALVLIFTSVQSLCPQLLFGIGFMLISAVWVRSILRPIDKRFEREKMNGKMPIGESIHMSFDSKGIHTANRVLDANFTYKDLTDIVIGATAYYLHLGKSKNPQALIVPFRLFTDGAQRDEFIAFVKSLSLNNNEADF